MDTRVWVWGLPFAPLTRAQALEAVVNLVEAGQPSYFITANTHYAMLTKETPDLKAINTQAAFVLADGAPLVWASRWKKAPLPERVTGSDLIFDLCGEAARNGYRVFLLGGAEGVADEAARRLAERHPGLKVVGTESPPYRDLTPEEQDQLIGRVQSASPDILIRGLDHAQGRNLDRGELRAAGRAALRQPWRGARFRRRPGPSGPAPTPEARPGMGLPDVSRAVAAGTAYARNARFLLSMVARDLVQGVADRLPWPWSRTLTKFNPPQATGR